MRRRHIATFALLIFPVAMIALCCDRRSESPPPDLATPNATITAAPGTEPPASRPTTQELLTGPTRRIGLQVMPLSAEVPQSWEISTISMSPQVQKEIQSHADPSAASLVGLSLVELRGPAPSGDVQIQLGTRTGQTSERLDRMLKAAQRDADSQMKHGGNLKNFQICQQDNMRVMEVQKVLAPDNGPKLLVWTITFFAPHASSSGDFDGCELSFLNLTLDQYEHDQAFLRKIIDSVHYDPAAMTTSATAPAAAGASR